MVYKVVGYRVVLYGVSKDDLDLASNTSIYIFIVFIITVIYSDYIFIYIFIYTIYIISKVIIVLSARGIY